MRALSGFLIVGGVGFVVDIGLLETLLRFGVPPIIARIPAISAALLVTWMLNRRFSFRMNTPPKVGELLAYGSVAGFSAMVNYAVFAGLVVAGVGPIAALALATAATMTINFLGFKKLVFRRS